MIDHCVATIHAQEEDKIYRAYVTDALKALVENSSHYIIPGHGVVDYGVTLTRRWVVDRTENDVPEPHADNRSCAEIAAGVWDRMRHGR